MKGHQWLMILASFIGTSCVSDFREYSHLDTPLKSGTPAWPDLSMPEVLPLSEEEKLKEFVPPSRPTKIIRITPDFGVLLKKMKSMSRAEFDLWLFNNHPIFKLWLDEQGLKFLKENFDIDDPNDKKYRT